MKIIKLISCFMVISLLATLICSCVKTPPDQKTIVEFSNLTVLEVYSNSDSGNHAQEYPLWSSEKVLDHVDPSAPEKYTVKFNGTKYIGDYQDSYVAYGASYISHEYSVDDIKFTINADTGELTSFRHTKNPYPQYNTHGEAECRKIADEFAGKHIDVSNYKVTADFTAELNRYKFTYDRMIGQLQTSEYLTVTVDTSGNIISFTSSMLNSLKNVVNVVYDEEKVIDAIENKLKSIYKDVGNYEGYEVEGFFITKLKDGGYGFFYSVAAEFERIDLGDGTYYRPSTLINLLVKGSTTKLAN